MAMMSSNNPYSSATMTELHPSNPYYSLGRRRLDEGSSSPAEHKDSRMPQRSMSEAPAPPPSKTSQTMSSSAGSAGRRPSDLTKCRTHSVGGPFCAGVYFDRPVDLSPPNDEEIIIATVRVTDSFRRASIEGGDELPSRYECCVHTLKHLTLTLHAGHPVAPSSAECLPA